MKYGKWEASRNGTAAAALRACMDRLRGAAVPGDSPPG
jgi:hypothetical protein